MREHNNQLHITSLSGYLAALDAQKGQPYIKQQENSKLIQYTFIHKATILLGKPTAPTASNITN